MPAYGQAREFAQVRQLTVQNLGVLESVSQYRSHDYELELVFGLWAPHSLPVRSATA